MGGEGGGMVENSHEHGEGDASGSPETLVQRLGNNHCDRELYNE